MSVSSPLNEAAERAAHILSDEEIELAHAHVVKTVKSGKSRHYEFRVQQLTALRNFLTENEAEIISAVHHDLHRSKFEAVVCEIIPAVTEIDHFLAHLHQWMKPEQTPLPALFVPGQSLITREPFGCVLVLGAFNYPVALTVSLFLFKIHTFQMVCSFHPYCTCFS
jgi:aldehyde dehydrogenase (NAD+)